MTRYSGHPGPRARTTRLLTAVLALGLLGPASTAFLPGPAGTAARPRAAVGTPLVQETFTGATADADFTAVGAACLTGAPSSALPGPGSHPLGGCPVVEAGPVPPLDAAPYGYLRLTDAGTDQSGAVLYDHALPAGNGLDVTFDQWQYGSTTPAHPADGISFFLVDGDTSLAHPGAFGGSLGYAQKLPDDNPANEFLPGVDRGYLGVGLDVLGNYFGDWEQRGNGCQRRSPAGTAFRVPGPGANMVTVRGPGDGVQGYCFLAATTSNLSTTGPWPSTLPGLLQGPLTALPPGATPEQAQAALEPSRRRVNVHLTPAPAPVLTVSVDFNDGAGMRQVLSAPAPDPVPATYKFGFAASTGLFTDVHLIRNVAIGTDQPLPTLDLVKQPREPLPGLLVAGTPVPYDFVVTNGGTTPVTDVRVSDPLTGPVGCPVTTLAGGESVTCTATYTVTAEDVARGYVTNTATASGTAAGVAVTSPPAEATVPIAAPPGLAVEKHTDTAGPFAVGDTVPYTYRVANTGGYRVTALAVSDDKVAAVTCDATELAPAGSPGDDTACHGSYLVTAADAAAGHVTNTATAHGTAGGQPVVSGPVEATVVVVRHAGLRLDVHADTAGPVHPGDTVRYTYRVTNTGDTALHGVAVTDDRVSPVTCDSAALALGAGTDCHGALLVTDADATAGHLTNTAVATATDTGGTVVHSAPAQATVTVTPCPDPAPAPTHGPGHPGHPVRAGDPAAAPPVQPPN